MKIPFFFLIILLILLSTYKPNFDFKINSTLNIKSIKIENNSVLDSDDIKKKLNFLYKENLFFLKVNDIEKKLKTESFIESFSIKKVYPNKLILKITEKKPIAVIQNKKKRFFISSKGDLIRFIEISKFNTLPIVFGNGKNFYNLYQNLQKINFPLDKITSFYYFESGRWDLIMNDDKTIKLPTKNYLISLENFMDTKNYSKFKKYKIFDYRIKDQLILN